MENGEKKSKLITVLDTFGNLFVLNVLFILFSLPVITFGASLTAMYSTTLKMVKNEEGGIWKTFWKAFKSNFKKATLVWLMAAVVLVVIAGELLFAGSVTGAMSVFYLIVAAIEICVLCLIVGFLPAIIARYDNTVMNSIKNSLLLAISNLWSWIKVSLIWFMPIFFTFYYLDVLFIYTWYLWLIFIFALLAYCSSIVIIKVFDKVTRTQNANEEEKAEKEKIRQEIAKEKHEKIMNKMKSFENKQDE